jgi:glycosyltransferase involved in cell wall biosynthesis
MRIPRSLLDGVSMKKYLISVVLPCHGSLPYIQETISSLLAQTFDDFEVILVNDRVALSDLDFVLSLRKLDSRFQIVKSIGEGISNALNTGITTSNSNLIARIDADDVMDSERLKVQFREMQLNNRVSCMGSQLKIVNESGDLLRYTNFPTSSREISEMMKLRNVVAHPSVLFRKEAVTRVGSYRSFFDGAEDYDLWLRLLRSGEIMNLKQPLTSYRIHPTQETAKNRDVQQEMDSLTRFYAFAGTESVTNIELSSLKARVSSKSINFRGLVKKSNLPHNIQSDLLASSELNKTISNPNFFNLLRSLWVLFTHPKLFLLASKYSAARFLHVTR